MAMAAVSGPFDGLAHEPRRHGVHQCVSCSLDTPAGRTPSPLGAAGDIDAARVWRYLAVGRSAEAAASAWALSWLHSTWWPSRRLLANGDSLDLLLPIVVLRQQDAWLPYAFAQWWSWASIIVGWDLATALIAALTGIKRG